MMSSKIIYQKDILKIRRCRVRLKNFKVRTKECHVSVASVPKEVSSGVSLERVPENLVSKDSSMIEDTYSSCGKMMDQMKIEQNVSNSTKVTNSNFHFMHLPLFEVCYPNTLPPLQLGEQIHISFKDVPGELSTFEVMDIIDLEEGTSTISSGTCSSSSTHYQDSDGSGSVRSSLYEKKRQGPSVPPLQPMIRLRRTASSWEIMKTNQDL